MLLCRAKKYDPCPSLMTQSLPIDSLLEPIGEHLQRHHNLILTAEPGAGKTTRLPLALLQQPWLAGKRILLLEPRRMAARNAAHYMATQLGQKVGQTVGYHIRLECKVSAQTRLEVITEGLLTQRLQQDPELSDVGLIIFDEFHERHLHSDLALALSHQCQQLLRDDLRLLVMSATLDSDALAQRLQAPCLHAPGRSFPVDVHYRPAQGQEDLLSHCIRVSREALRQDGGDILLFMPGVGAINAFIERWQDDSVSLFPLHGQLSDSQQRQALAVHDKRKIIVATNIAESSLTIEGVDIVIDSGLERVAVFQPSNGLQSLQTRAISQASAEQRSGRAGRQRAGQAFRLWGDSQHHSRAQHRDAEISRSDLAGLALELLKWGAQPQELLWLTPPPTALINQANDLLEQLDIRTPQGTLSEHGQQCAQLGLEPRWAHALLLAAQHGCQRQAAELAAYLQQWPHNQRRSDDIERELAYAQRQPLWQQRIEPLCQRWLHALPAIEVTVETKLSLAQIVCLAFPDRIAKRRPQQNRALLACGSGAELSPNSDLLHYDWLVVARLGGLHGRIDLAAGIASNQQLLQHPWLSLQSRTDVSWNDQGQLQAAEKRCLGELVLSQSRLTELSAQQWHSAWDDYFRRRGLSDLSWDDKARNLQRRIALLATQQPSWPDCSDDALLDRRSEWLLPQLNDCRHPRQLQQLNMTQLLIQQLDWSQQQQLEQQLPEQWLSPTGRLLTIDYQQTPPRVSARLQEFLGCQQHPQLAGQPLTVELLSPAGRPIQITADLPGFWCGSYQQVRKDMRGRYPKHHWPEDPANAAPLRHSLKHKNR